LGSRIQPHAEPKKLRISTGGEPARSKIKSGPAVGNPKITFSFRYFAQVDKYFGVGEVEKAWFLNLLYRLGALNAFDVDVFRTRGELQDQFRYHQVNWTQKNIPIQRNDLSWLPPDYRDNDVDFPFYQFSITTSNGRFAGFWDEASVFNIVLFDPHHNLQPSKRFNYVVTNCTKHPIREEVLEMCLERIDRYLMEAPIPEDVRSKARGLLKPSGSFAVFYIEHDRHAQLEAIRNSVLPYSHSQVLEEGITTMLKALGG
jgi:hypothetical protein